jgi:NAD(P)-dependent dehydrogenase (short-subunit alcohol dehydrogenase family)
MRLKDKVAIVTGGGVGIGKAISLAFAREGADIVLACPFLSELEPTAAEINSLGRKSLAVVTDVSDEEQVREMVAKTVGEFGKIDILVNSAGIEGRTANVVDVDLEDWNRVLAVNLTGPMLCSKEVLKIMVPHKSGSIINISSAAGKRGFVMRSPYCASKWGVIGLTQTVALEVGVHNIRVNCICPGPTEGERIERVLNARVEATGRPYQELRALMTGNNPLGRMVYPEEVAAAAVFLASAEAGGLTGQAINVSIGLIMG